MSRTIFKINDHYRIQVSSANNKRLELIYNGKDSDFEDTKLSSYYNTSDDIVALIDDVEFFGGIFNPAKPHFPKSRLNMEKTDAKYITSLEVYNNAMRLFCKRKRIYNGYKNSLIKSLQDFGFDV